MEPLGLPAKDLAVRPPPIGKKEALRVVEGHYVLVAHVDADLALELVSELGLFPGLRPVIAPIRIVAA